MSANPAFQGTTLQTPAHDYSDLTIIVPTKNEAEVITELLSVLDNQYFKAQLLVVDDESQDGTQELVQRCSQRFHSSTVHLCERVGSSSKGLTSSVLEAIQLCEREYFVVIDADFQHPPEKIAEMIQILRQGADVVIGTRKGPSSYGSSTRQLLSYFATIMAKNYLRFFKTTAQDPLSGFFGGNTVCLQDLICSTSERFEHRGFKVLFDLLKIAKGRLTLAEVSYIFHPRRSGYSKFKLRHGFYFLRSILK